MSDFDLLYNTPLNELSLTDLHRVIKGAHRRQLRVAWLAHRHRRIQILVRERRRRINAIAEQEEA